jgi:hypothetical protein
MGSVLINGYKGSIYPEGSGYTGVLDLGWTADGKRNRPKRKGRNKEIVKAKLLDLANDLVGQPHLVIFDASSPVVAAFGTELVAPSPA